MNKIDKEWYKALRFLSRLSLEKYDELKKKNLNKLRRYVDEELEDTLEQHEYIIFKNNINNVVTMQGLLHLRDLEEIRRKDLTLIASVVAVVISLVALAKSMGWI